jgi:WD40 repeat protein
VAIGRIADRDLLVSGGLNGTVRVWDASTRAPVGDPRTAHTDTTTAVAVGSLHGQDVILSASGDGTVRIADPHTGDPLTVIDLDGPVSTASFIAPNSLVAAVNGALSLHTTGATGIP